MKLRSGTKVPFLNKNLPKRKYTRAYDNPLPEETEDQLATSFANLSLYEDSSSQSDLNLQPVLLIYRFMKIPPANQN